MSVNPYLMLVVLALVIGAIVVVVLRRMIGAIAERREAPAAPRRLGEAGTEYYRGTLRQAADAAGGEAELAAALNVPPESLRRWLEGKEAPPIEVHLAALDLVTRGTPEAKAE